MLIVPLNGDQIKTIDGLPFKVLAFTNYKSEGPSVLVEKQGSTETVDFRDIAQVGKSKVRLLKNADGSKVFQADGVVERKFHLPQPGDTITADPFGVGASDYIVTKLSLGVKDRLASGLIVSAKGSNDGDAVDITLGQITDIDQTIFSQSGFLKYYADYSEKGSAKAPQEGTGT